MLCFDVDVRPFSLYTVVEECKHRLLKSGFVELKEKDSWEVKQEGKVCMCVTGLGGQQMMYHKREIFTGQNFCGFRNWPNIYKNKIHKLGRIVFLFCIVSQHLQKFYPGIVIFGIIHEVCPMKISRYTVIITVTIHCI